MAAPGVRLDRIGIDRLVRLDWLERAALLALAEPDPVRARAGLRDELAGHFRSAAPGGSLDKTVRVLCRTWIRPPKYARALRDDGLEWLRRLPRAEHLPFHWGMMLVAYPFWGMVARQTGRLLGLQGRVMAAQVQQRLREQYGERETVARRVRYVLRSFVHWGVLRETGRAGVYEAGRRCRVEGVPLVAWLLEAYLTGSDQSSISLAELPHNPALFPLEIDAVSPHDVLSQRDRLDSVPSGLDAVRVTLRAPGRKPSSAFVS